MVSLLHRATIKEAFCSLQQGCCRRLRKGEADDERVLRGSKRAKVCEAFACKWQELIFNRFLNFSQQNNVSLYDGRSDNKRIYRSFNNRACEKLLNCLKSFYVTRWKFIVYVTTTGVSPQWRRKCAQCPSPMDISVLSAD